MIVLTLVPIDVYASVGDNVGNSKLEQLVGEPTDVSTATTLFGMLRQLVDGIGVGKLTVTPTAEQYANASLVEKVNYLQVRLEQVFQSASDGKLLLQSSLANEGISINTTSPQTFETINNSLNLLCTNYKTKLGELDEALLKANSLKTLIVSVSGWEGYCDGQPHGITVLADADLYDVTYGTSAEDCTLSESPTYTARGKYTIWYNIQGKQNEKALAGKEVVNIKGYDLSTASVSWTGAEGTVIVKCDGVILTEGAHYTVSYTTSVSGDYRYKYATITAASGCSYVTGSCSSRSPGVRVAYVGINWSSFEEEYVGDSFAHHVATVTVSGAGYYPVGTQVTLRIKFNRYLNPGSDGYDLTVNGSTAVYYRLQTAWFPGVTTMPNSIDYTVATRTVIAGTNSVLNGSLSATYNDYNLQWYHDSIDYTLD